VSAGPQSSERSRASALAVAGTCPAADFLASDARLLAVRMSEASGSRASRVSAPPLSSHTAGADTGSAPDRGLGEPESVNASTRSSAPSPSRSTIDGATVTSSSTGRGGTRSSSRTALEPDPPAPFGSSIAPSQRAARWARPAQLASRKTV
jgi:hypothetical protein